MFVVVDGIELSLIHGAKDNHINKPQYCGNTCPRKDEIGYARKYMA